MNMMHWSVAPVGKGKVPREKNLPHWNFVYHKSHRDWSGIEPRGSWWEAGNQPPKSWHCVTWSGRNLQFFFKRVESLDVQEKQDTVVGEWGEHGILSNTSKGGGAIQCTAECVVGKRKARKIFLGDLNGKEYSTTVMGHLKAPYNADCRALYFLHALTLPLCFCVCVFLLMLTACPIT
jgi:predicted outer membrane repeat protein